MKKILLPFIILFAISAIFFLPLYFPETKAIITAEFRGGDIVNMHYPYKFFEQSQLRQGIIPLWSRYTGMGFPIFGQSEIGLFNPINTISLLFLDVFDAMIVQIIIAFFIMLMSCYYLGRVLKMQRLSSIFLAVVYTFSAYPILSIVHFPHIEAIGLIPLVFALSYQFSTYKKIRYFIFAVVAFVFQLSSGHFQNSYITLVFLAVFFGGEAILTAKRRIGALLKTGFALAVGITFAFSLSAVQLVSTFFFIQQSPRASDFFYIANPISFTPTYLFTLFSPFVFGNPKTGAYPFFDLIMPWDGTLFIGYLPLIFILIFIVVKWKGFIKDRLVKLLLLSLIFFFLLAWEKNSPLYFIFSIPPFSLFRANSRYLVINILILSIFAGFGFDYIVRRWGSKKITMLLLSFVIFFHLTMQFSFMYNWHTTTSKSEFMKPPKSLELVKNAVRIFSYGEVEKINDIFIQQGFEKDKTIYLDILKNTLATDFNLFYKVPSFNNSISGVNLRRHEFFYFKITPFLYINVADPGFVEQNFYTLTGIDHVISLKRLDSHLLDNVGHYPLRSNLTVYVYRVKNNTGLISLYTAGTFITTSEELHKNIQEVSLSNRTLIETDMSSQLRKLLLSGTPSSSLKHFSLERSSDGKVVITADSVKDGLLVFRENFDPLWTAKIDNKAVQIYRAQFLNMGVWLPKGRHTVTFEYSKKYFGLGIVISATTLVIAIVLLSLKQVRKRLE